MVVMLLMSTPSLKALVFKCAFFCNAGKTASCQPHCHA